MIALPSFGTPTIQGTSENKDFLNLWLKDPSWSPIHRTGDRWVTAKSKTGKQVPLTKAAIQRCYNGKAFQNIIGKRFGKKTAYLMLDIDSGSQYHPKNGSLSPVLSAMEEIGLCRYLLVRSSDSEGLHVYFPLAESVGSWAIASAVTVALKANDVAIAPGTCELFPNKRAYNSDYNGHRLPLQRGSYILDEDFAPVTQDMGAFVAQWAIASQGQDFEALSAHLQQPAAIATGDSELPVWTSKSQSNKIMMRLGILAVEKGMRSVGDIAQWVKYTIRHMPGFAEYCSRASKRDIEHGWATRIAKWALRCKQITRRVMKKAPSEYNNQTAAEALARVKSSLEHLSPSPDIGIKKLWQGLSATSKELFGVGIAWTTFDKHREWILKAVREPEPSPPSKNGDCPNDTHTQKGLQPSHSPLITPSEGTPCNSLQSSPQGLGSTKGLTPVTQSKSFIRSYKRV